MREGEQALKKGKTIIEENWVKHFLNYLIAKEKISKVEEFN